MASAITPQTFRDFLNTISEEDYDIRAEKLEQFFINHGIQAGDNDPAVVKKVEVAAFVAEGWPFPETHSMPEDADDLEEPAEILAFIHPVTAKVHHLIIWGQRLYAYSTAYGPDEYEMNPVRPVQLRPTLAVPTGPDYNYYDIKMPDGSHSQLGAEWGEQHFPDGLDCPPVGANLIKSWGDPPIPGTTRGGWEAVELWQDTWDGSHYVIQRAYPSSREEPASPECDIWIPVTIHPFTREPELVW